ncbi:MAG: DMT family transporter [Mycobacterium sp.]|uniref:DMT family transporter n=1 Tax=Mycobacterium sp. TaxID=1785 RepID=UPI002611DEF6|nr:DMT family transporter [Mycobacterium sp.]MDI3314430.1 DMT family transporter [Mycobacterium sp.]
MSKADIAVWLALCAALAAAIGSVIRQRSAQEITEKPVGPVALFALLVRDTRWWLGGAGDIASYCLLAVALDKGSVMLVMALQVTALLFALPIYARVTRHRITAQEWLWAILLAGALAIVVAVGQPKAGTSHGSLGSWIVVGAVMGPLLGLCVLGARAWADRPAAAVLLAAVSGSSLALFAVLTKGVVEVVEHGAGRLLHSAELYAWLLAGLTGMIYQQSAFRAGALTASLPTMTVAKPVVASVLGITVLGETLNADGTEWVALGVAAAVVIVATIALARGEAATMAAGAGRDARIAQRPAAPSQP